MAKRKYYNNPKVGMFDAEQKSGRILPAAIPPRFTKVDPTTANLLIVNRQPLGFLIVAADHEPLITDNSSSMREIVSTPNAPQAIGPYSQAVKANGFIFSSGQVAFDPSTQQIVAGDISAQTDRVLRNLSAILEAAGSSLAKVVRTTVYLKNMDDFAAMNQVYAKYFPTAPPARSTVEAARLPRDVQIEIDVIAQQ